jgi:hypothetical protein
MAKDPVSFSISIDELQSRIDGEVDRLVKVFALSIFTAVTLATPVGDPDKWQFPNRKPKGYVGGRARGNWQVSNNNPVTKETGQIDPSGRGTIAEGKQMIRSIPVGNKIILQNNVPYIGVLNNGREDGERHSFQAPIGFVEQAIEAAQQAFDSERFSI